MIVAGPTFLFAVAAYGLDENGKPTVAALLIAGETREQAQETALRIVSEDGWRRANVVASKPADRATLAGIGFSANEGAVAA